MYLSRKDKVDDVFVLEFRLKPTCRCEGDALCAARHVLHSMQCAVGINRVDGEIAPYTFGDADSPAVGSILEVAFIIEHQKAHTTRTYHSIERVCLVIDIFRWLTRSRQIAGELSDVTIQANILANAILAVHRDKTCGWNMFHTVLNEKNLAVLHRVFGYGGFRLVDVGLPCRDIMVAIVLDVEVVGGLKEAIDGEEIREVFLGCLAYLADELQVRVVIVDGRALRLHPVCTQSLEELGIEGGVLLCLMIV